MSNLRRRPFRPLWLSALPFLAGCLGLSSSDSPEPWEPRREILSFAIVGDTAIDAKLYSYDVQHKGSYGDELHNRMISFVRIDRRNGSVDSLLFWKVGRSYGFSEREDPQLPGFLYDCSYGEIYNGRHVVDRIQVIDCEGDALAASPGGYLAAYSTPYDGIMVYDTAKKGVLQLPRDTVLELDHVARTATTLSRDAGGTALWRKYAVSGEVTDSARLSDPVLAQVEGIGIGIACSDGDAAAGSAPCRALSGVPGLREAARAHCRTNLCEWVPSLGKLAILEPGILFRFLDPATGKSETFKAGGLLRGYRPGE